MGRLLVSIVALLAACAAAAGDMDRPGVIEIPAGPFVAGSDRAEREHAYRLDERGYGHSLTRQQQWYEGERDRQTVELPAYEITTTLVTNAEYARFVAASGYPAPGVDPPTWQVYGLIHPFERTRRHAWAGGAPPAGRADHPVVLVTHGDALAYAAWLSLESGESRRLPTELEWEKAARGTDGRWFPWGTDWNPMRLNSADRGPFDTMAVGSFPDGASPFGLLDPAGQVFEWTATAADAGRFVVKGGSWDDRGCGVCRPGARHARPGHLKHILIGFRLVRGVE
jgi:formylglycine-generating enzyme required for sulfatase activity